ncbi:435R [Invertebrate iridescent virus Kaz2018]|nr:435R [Invertebrate iridescent virus Kaz2018]
MILKIEQSLFFKTNLQIIFIIRYFFFRFCFYPYIYFSNIFSWKMSCLCRCTPCNVTFKNNRIVYT